MSKKTLAAVIVLAVAIAGYFGYRYWRDLQAQLPEGIASGNGRIEAKLVDVAAKESLRVKEILADEGKLVAPGEVLVRMDTATLEAELNEAKASVASANERMAASKSAIVRRKSEIELAKVELERARKLLEENAGSKQDFDRRKTGLEVQKATLEEDEAKLRTSTQEVEVAQSNVATIQTRIDDATLTSPVRGRVL